jgi:hypothetical protein
VASNFHHLDYEIEPDINFQRYPLRSDPAAMLVSPLRTPPHRRGNTDMNRISVLLIATFRYLTLLSLTILLAKERVHNIKKRNQIQKSY